MTNITHDLILTPILRLQIAQGATGDGKPMVDLAEQFHLASIQIRGIIDELNPGRQFELNQVAQFGVDRLEDGEVFNG